MFEIVEMVLVVVLETLETVVEVDKDVDVRDEEEVTV